VSERKLWFFV